MLQCDPPAVAAGGGARGRAWRRHHVGSGGGCKQRVGSGGRRHHVRSVGVQARVSENGR